MGIEETLKAEQAKLAEVEKRLAAAEKVNAARPESDTIKFDTSAVPREDKNIRKPLQATEKQSDRETSFRSSPLNQSRMDWVAQYYVDRHPEKQFFWENNINGQVERWLSVDAELVPRESKSIREYEGFTSKQNSTWECIIGVGDIDGNSFDAYLLMISPEEYHRNKIAPVEARNAEIRNRLTMGSDTSNEQTHKLPGGGSINTYAPNLVTGGRGFETVEE